MHGLRNLHFEASLPKLLFIPGHFRSLFSFLAASKTYIFCLSLPPKHTQTHYKATKAEAFVCSLSCSGTQACGIVGIGAQQ